VAGAIISVPATLRVSTLPIFTLAGLTNGHPRLQINGTAGDHYNLEFSTNLLGWTEGSILTNTTGALQFIDVDSTNYTRRFYRCRVRLD